MPDPTPADLPARVLEHLSAIHPAVLATVDEDGSPRTALISWLVALDERHIALAVDTRGGSFRNMHRTGRATLAVLGDDLVYSVSGHAEVAHEKMESPPFPSAALVLHVEAARDQLTPGISFEGPRYKFVPGKERLNSVDEAVCAELRRLRRV